MIMKLIRDEKVKYLFWGVATTFFYFVFRFIVNVLTNNPTIAAFLAEVVTIIFAFYVNRTFVFTNQKSTSLTYQLMSFFAGRVIVAVFDIVVTYVTIEKYHSFFIRLLGLDKLNYHFLRSIWGTYFFVTPYQINNVIWVVIIQIFAIIFNYLVSKYYSFK